MSLSIFTKKSDGIIIHYKNNFTEFGLIWEQNKNQFE
jgi:hypothetical protein